MQILRYALAIILPPVAVGTLDGMGGRLFVSVILTLILPVLFAGFMYLNGHWSVLYIFIDACLILPGSAYAIWVTTEYYSIDDDLSTPGSLPTMAEPKPQRMVNTQPGTFLTAAVTPSPVTGTTPGSGDIMPLPASPYKGKYSPMTISPYSSNVSNMDGKS